MALWKPYRGNRTGLDTVEKHDGYVYFCTDDGSLFFDYVDSDGNLQRKQISAKDAETLMGKSLVELQSDWSVNDPASPAYIHNRPFYKTTEDKTYDLSTVSTGYELLPGFTVPHVGTTVALNVNGVNVEYVVKSSDIMGDYIGSKTFTNEEIENDLFSGWCISFSDYDQCASLYWAESTDVLVLPIVNITPIPEEFLPKAKMTFVSSAHNATEISDDDLKNIQVTVPVLNGSYGDEEVVCSPDGKLHLRHDYAIPVNIGAIELNSNTFTEGQFTIPYAGGTFQKLVVIDTYTKTKCEVIIDTAHISGVNSSVGIIDKTYTQALAYINGDLFTFETNAIDQDEAAPDTLTLTVKKSIPKTIQNGLDSKLNKNNPVGTGSLSMNRKSGSSEGISSTTLGYNNSASGVYAYAEGYNTSSSGYASHSEGVGTRTSRQAQHVQGRYNVLDTDASTHGKYAHIVGNGTALTACSNAHTLDWSGNAWFAGEVKVGGSGQDDSAAKTLATTDDLSWNALKDRPFYYVEDAIIYAATITTEDFGGFFAYMDQSDAVKSYPALVDGETYTVVFDGVSYSCVCVAGYLLGNLGLLEYGEDTGEPFGFMLYDGSAISVITTDTTSTQHSIQVTGPAIKTIDKMYFPELPYVTLQQGNQHWVNKGDFAQTNSNLTYKGQSYMTNHEYFLYFLTAEGIWQLNLVTSSYEQTPAMSSFRMNYSSSDGTLSFYWKDESNTTEITTYMYAYLYNVNTGNIIRRASGVQSVTIGAYIKKSHNVDFYINKNNPQTAEIVRSFDDYIESYSKDEVEAMIASIKPKSTTVTISASKWTGSTNPWSQTVTINGVTKNSKLDLGPTAQQIVALQNAGVALMLQNDSGVVTAWAIGNKPTTDYTINVLITEVHPV